MVSIKEAITGLAKLFVFDDRLTVPFQMKKPVIGKCYHCQVSNESYYNVPTWIATAYFFAVLSVSTNLRAVAA